MIWILLLLVGLISVIYFGKQGKDYLVISGLVGALLSAILLAAFVPKGITTYPRLVGQLHEIKVLQQELTILEPLFTQSSQEIWSVGV